MYLGIPLFVGVPRDCWIKQIADKIKNRLISWKGLKLSFVGRLCLINFVIVGHFDYYFQVYRWPTNTLKDLNVSIQNGSIDIKKSVVVAWNHCCKPKDEGGLRLRDLRSLHGVF